MAAQRCTQAAVQCHLVRRVLAALAALVLTGCMTTWQAQQAPPAQLIGMTGETDVQVTLTSGAQTVLRDPGVEGDSLVGWAASSNGGSGADARQAFALRDVAHLATRKNDAAVNVLAGLATGSAIFFATIIGIWVAVCSQGCD
jgi:hypothetical protein